MKSIRVYWLTCLSILAAVAASATTIVLPTDEQLVSKSPVIVAGMVISSQPIEGEKGIWTETHLLVEQTLKGSASSEITIREVGGQVENRITKVFGSPVYAAGERVLAFLTPTVRGDYQTIDLFVGKFAERRTMAGQRLWTRDDNGADVLLLDAQFEAVRTNRVQRDADAFESFIRDRVVGRKPMAVNYGVENPVLAGQLATPTSGGRAIHANFTLIEEGTVYRWFAFQNGSSAKWFSYGTQTGYIGGGVNEISTAMNSWNGYSAAKINYAYSGAGSGTPAGLGGRNNVNEILFSDPLGEIAGSFNPSTGGVVGQGGFNGVSGPLSWTAPFAADASHPQTTFAAYNIIEGNLTIQDGVSPANGLSSTRLAEIVAHEFGHTLGFGHSADSTALMYFQVTGLGPALRGDDQVAARWLYPSGTATTPPPTSTPAPSAPSGLTATSSPTVVTLQWTDNSASETGFWIYAAIAGGSFSRVGTSPLGANTTGANISGLSGGVNYQFHVTAVNAGGESAASNVVTAALTGTQASPLTAAFLVTPSSGVAGSTVFAFVDQSTGSVASRSWTFGDGGSSSATNPTHVYNAAGSYNIVLTVSNGSSSTSVTHGVSVASSSPAGPPVSAAFDTSLVSPHPGDAVSFSDRSSGNPTTWLWSFGDGSSSTLKSPTHAYAAVGNYRVDMTASSATSSSVAVRVITVTQRNQLSLNGSRFTVTLSARDQRTGRTAGGVAI
ncbi:MAG: PKD domain-containing protein, partial [Thermoanaerobaculia bacterium]